MCISDSDPKFLVDTLLLLSKGKMRGSLLDEMWKAHFIDRKVRLAFEGLLGEDDGALIRAICRKANGVTPVEVRAALKRAKITVDFPVIKVPEQTASPTPSSATSVEAKPAAGSRREAGKKLRETTPAMSEAMLQNLIAAGLSERRWNLERSYRDVKLTASIQADGVSFGGESYDSLSTAAGMARKTVIDAPPGRPYPQTNGWTFWRFRDPKTGAMREMDSLRQQFVASKK